MMLFSCHHCGCVMDLSVSSIDAEKMMSRNPGAPRPIGCAGCGMTIEYTRGETLTPGPRKFVEDTLEELKSLTVKMDQEATKIMNKTLDDVWARMDQMFIELEALKKR